MARNEMDLQISEEDCPRWMQTEITLDEEFRLEDGLRYVLRGCTEDDRMDLLRHLVRENFRAAKIIDSAGEYIEALEEALVVSVRS